MKKWINLPDLCTKCIRVAAKKSSFFSSPTTKRVGGNGPATKENFMILFYENFICSR